MGTGSEATVPLSRFHAVNEEGKTHAKHVRQLQGRLASLRESTAQALRRAEDAETRAAQAEARSNHAEATSYVLLAAGAAGMADPSDALVNIAELRTTYYEPIVHEYLNAIQRNFSELRPLYVACFTELRDDLSQWRGYAAGRAGYALRFDNLYADGTRVVKIEYSPERQRYLLDQRVARTAELLVQARREATCAQVSELLKWAVTGSVNQLTQILLICKDEAFAAEREWRMCYGRPSDYPEQPFSFSWPGPELPLSFRASDQGVVPYVNLCLRGPEPPLTEILTASGMDRTTAIAMAEAVCRQRGLEGVDVNPSKIPLRY